MITLSYHAFAAVIVFSALVGGQFWKGLDEKRKASERKRIWKREQDKLPRAIRD